MLPKYYYYSIILDHYCGSCCLGWALAYYQSWDFHTATVVKKLSFLLRLEHPFLQGTCITPTYSSVVPKCPIISLKIYTFYTFGMIWEKMAVYQQVMHQISTFLARFSPYFGVRLEVLGGRLQGNLVERVFSMFAITKTD